MIRIGTSGYNYPEWKGPFYPDGLPTTRMFAFYAERFGTVEINYTFYRMPTPSTIAGWVRAAPPGFLYTLKAPKRITHDKRLRDCSDATTRFLEMAAGLGDCRGCLLFQLPPNLRRDDERLAAFLDTLPGGTRAAFEFRHPSWFDPAVFSVLGSRNLAVCVAESDTLQTPVVTTADFAYFRLRDEGYTPADIKRWAGVLRGLDSCQDVFVYFKHEAAGTGPRLAAMLMKELGETR
ncbi:MAG: DUF72 domain-containing protein [Acidobacteriota bacterium]